MITFNFKIIVEIANGGDAVKQVVYMHKFRERGFIRRPTYVASWIKTVSSIFSDKVTKISISSATVDGPQKPAKLDEQAIRPIQPAKIPYETSI